MWRDVQDLHGFYQTPQGCMVQTLLFHHLNEKWANVHNLNVGAYGYALPYLSTFFHEARHILAMMPAPMGATPWSEGSPLTKVILCQDGILPLKDNSLDRLLVVHALEFTGNPCAFLREAWRVLTDGGELMIVVPNRRGLWARSANSPFGFGNPYTGRQLYGLLENNLFIPDKPSYALFHPPLRKPLSYRLYQQIETGGSTWFKKMGGVVVVKAQKQTMAGIKEVSKTWVQRIFIPPKEV